MAKSVEMKRHPSRRSSLAVSMSARNPAADLIELPDEMWQRIAKKAYELYEQRDAGGARTRGLVRSGVRRHGRDS